MLIAYSAQKELLSLPKEVASELLAALRNYIEKQRGHINWLEQRPGYSLRARNFSIIFEVRRDTIHVLQVRSAVET